MHLALSDAAVFELNHCNKCGFCLPACPTYAVTHDEMHSPRGRLSLVEAAWRGEVPVDDTGPSGTAGGLVAALGACLGCRACETACPSGVRYGVVLEDARADLFARARVYTMPHPMVSVLLRAVERRRWLGRLLWAGRMARALPMPTRLKQAVALVPPAPVRSTRRVASPSVGVGTRQPVVFMATCMMETAYGETNRRARQLLEAAGAEVFTVPNEPCCGALHLHSGDRKRARELARQNLERWRSWPADAWIVSHSGGCGAMYREYGHLLADEDELGAEAAQRAAQVHDFAWALAHLPRRPVFERRTAKASIQNSCHLVNVLHEGEWAVGWVREAVTAFHTLPSQDRCCGSAGVYNLNQPGLAQEILAQHVAEWRATGLDRLIVNNPGCALQCQSAFAADASNPVQQLADLLYEQWTGDTVPQALSDGTH